VSRIVVTGAAGFLGSHLCDRLLGRGDEVVGIDNLSTGQLDNLDAARSTGTFTFVRQDVCEPLEIDGRVDAVVHMASPASPPEYLRLPIETLRVGSRGTEMAIALAARSDARFVVSSTSEVYGDPLVHPQDESYWGNVNPIGPRSVYDEAKRFMEALTAAHARTHGLRAGIARIFNTYGPRLRPSDGRVVSNFVVQALAGEPLTIYGDGSQTRSFCYVDDLVSGLVSLVDADVLGPVNLGNPTEVTVADLAQQIVELTGSTSTIERHPLPADDPTRRRPDITRARELLGWAPAVELTEGLRRTIEWFRV
jgi:dTDP-glucose 4,6-dehydratase